MQTRAAAANALLLLVLLAGCASDPGERADGDRAAEPSFEPHVVVATLDSGGNPFHPTWRRDVAAHPSTYIPGYPAGTPALPLTFLPDYNASVAASMDALESLRGEAFPRWIPGTNLVGVWASPDDQVPVFDWEAIGTNLTSTSHGAQASSQIAGLGYSLAPDAYLVVMDRTEDGGGNPYRVNADGLRWAADQPWIDIIHTNIQNLVPLAQQTPLGETNPFEGYPEAVAYAVSKGKLVVSAGGNWYAEPTETSPHAGPAGVLVAGANDNCGYTSFSNPDPHVVMDGAGTVSAHPENDGNGTFGGTSSASPRITGYAARLLLDVRRHFGVTEGMRDGALVVLDDEATWPAQGPLADGKLMAAELHEAIRKTADPNPHASAFDGAQEADCIPQPVPLPTAAYAKMGYGEVSEHTVAAAVAVLVGAAPMPARPMEDAAYERSEQLRDAAWG